MSALFLIWYFAYVLLGAFAHDFMAIKVWGNINVGLLIGLGQFVSTFVITAIYVRFANRELDPRAEAIRAEARGRCGMTIDILAAERHHRRQSRRQHRHLRAVRRRSRSSS